MASTSDTCEHDGHYGNAMQLSIIGCGDAYDHEHTNASVMVSENHFNLLIDCGPTVPKELFSKGLKANDIDAIYITHSHPDHCLGLTTLLNWMGAKGRSKELVIIAQAAQFEVLEPLVRFAYWPDEHCSYPIVWKASEECNEMGPWEVETSKTVHAVSCRSLSLSNGRSRIFYSGDGKLTKTGEELAANSDVVFIECEYPEPHESHGDWQSISQLPKKVDSQWYLYHIDSSYREALATDVEPYVNIQLAEDNLCLGVG